MACATQRWHATHLNSCHPHISVRSYCLEQINYDLWLLRTTLTLQQAYIHNVQCRYFESMRNYGPDFVEIDVYEQHWPRSRRSGDDTRHALLPSYIYPQLLMRVSWISDKLRSGQKCGCTDRLITLGNPLVSGALINLLFQMTSPYSKMNDQFFSKWLLIK